nr:RNA-directed DNA polymerase, eukaryota, reverse transcriptase zinc-binding domain protein [Tanacetum cinerariifolium]
MTDLQIIASIAKVIRPQKQGLHGGAKMRKKTEKLTEIETPFLDDTHNLNGSLMVHRGSIHLCFTYENGKNYFLKTCIELWKMNEDGYWKKVVTYRVDPYDILNLNLKPLHLMSNGNLLMSSNKNGENLYELEVKKKRSKGKGKDKLLTLVSTGICKDVRYSETVQLLIAWIAWDKVISPLKDGGLDIGSLRVSNLSLLAKWWWRFLCETSSIWASVIKSIHGQHGGLQDISTIRNKSGAWFQIAKLNQDLTSYGIDLNTLFRLKIGNGESTSFWNNVWVGNSPLCNAFPRLFRLELHPLCRVCDRVPTLTSSTSVLVNHQPTHLVSTLGVSAAPPRTSAGIGVTGPPGLSFQWAWSRELRSTADHEELIILQNLLANLHLSTNPNTWNGVILGAYTIATEGPIVADKNYEKIHYMAPNIYWCGAGTAADTTDNISSQLKLHRYHTGQESRVVTTLTLSKSHIFWEDSKTRIVEDKQLYGTDFDDFGEDVFEVPKAAPLILGNLAQALANIAALDRPQTSGGSFVCGLAGQVFPKFETLIMRSKRLVKPTKIFDNSVNNTSKNKSKQKNALKKKDMFSNVRNNMDDLDGESDSKNCNEIVGNGDKIKEGIRRRSQKTYANMVTKDMKVVHNKLDFVPTVINEEGSEFVIFDETLVEKGSAYWKLTVCRHFVGYKMGVHELRYNIRRMWSKWGIDDIDMKADGTCMFKFRNEEGMNKVLELGPCSLASNLGRPLIMDNMAVRRCRFGEGRLDYARVLVEFDVTKGCKDKIEIQYRDENNNVKGSKQVNVKYDWKPESYRRQNKDGRFYNIGGKRNEAKGSKGDVWKKKEGNEERNNRQKNKAIVNGEKCQNEDVVKTGRMIVDTFLVKEIQPNGIEVKTWSNDMVKYFKDQKELKRLKEEEEMNDDIEDVLEVNSRIAKELNTEEVRGMDTTILN